MMKRLQTFFANQTPVARLIFAIALPLIFYFIFYAIAQNETSDYNSFSNETTSKPFNLSVTWFIWSLFIALTGLIEYCIWQPLKQ